jgi:hypothetical protein
MSTPYESADLILKLYDLRRETKMRDAREWFLREFHPETADEVVEVLRGENHARFRMVVGYWDMAAGLVTHGAIEHRMFVELNPEAFPTYAKLEPIMHELREKLGRPKYLEHLEGVVMKVPGVGERLQKLRANLKAAAALK